MLIQVNLVRVFYLFVNISILFLVYLLIDPDYMFVRKYVFRSLKPASISQFSDSGNQFFGNDFKRFGQLISFSNT